MNELRDIGDGAVVVGAVSDTVELHGDQPTVRCKFLELAPTVLN